MLVKWFKRLIYTVLVLFVLLNIMAAFHAYKFTHFYANIPLAKKPEQMSVPEKASAIFFGINYAKSKVTDSLTVVHDTISITTTDSIHLESWYIKADSNARGTILMFHGHGSNKSGIIREATAFHVMGWNVVMTDFRAHGNSEGVVCTIGANEAKDVKAVWDFVQAKGEKNMVLWGISLGAATTLKAVHDFQLQPQKIILEMPFGTLTDAVKGRLRTMHLPEQPLSTLLAFWGGVEQGFWAFNIDPASFATAVTCPVLLQWGVNDKRVTEQETNAIFTNISSKEKTLVRYEESGHESLCKKENQKWVSAVGSFLNR